MGDLRDSLSGQYRQIVLWVPDWQLAAMEILAGRGSFFAMASSNQIVAFNRMSKDRGVRLGMSKREARYHCSGLQIDVYDADRVNSAFEAVVSAFAKQAVSVQIIHPGLAWANANPGIKLAGSERELTKNVVQQIVKDTGVEAWCGVASSFVTACLAARQNALVLASETTHFLKQADLRQVLVALPPSLTEKLRPTVKELHNQGVRTAGQFCELQRCGQSSELAEPATSHLQINEGWQILGNLFSDQGQYLVDVEKQVSQALVSYRVNPLAKSMSELVAESRRASLALSNALTSSGSGATTLRIGIETVAGELKQRIWALVDSQIVSQVSTRVTWQLLALLSDLEAAPPKWIHLEALDSRSLGFVGADLRLPRRCAGKRGGSTGFVEAGKDSSGGSGWYNSVKTAQITPMMGMATIAPNRPATKVPAVTPTPTTTGCKDA